MRIRGHGLCVRGTPASRAAAAVQQGNSALRAASSTGRRPARTPAAKSSPGARTFVGPRREECGPAFPFVCLSYVRWLGSATLRECAADFCIQSRLSHKPLHAPVHQSVVGRHEVAGCETTKWRDSTSSSPPLSVDLSHRWTGRPISRICATASVEGSSAEALARSACFAQRSTWCAPRPVVVPRRVFAPRCRCPACSQGTGA
jgi:hypothetical protein